MTQFILNAPLNSNQSTCTCHTACIARNLGILM